MTYEELLIEADSNGLITKEKKLLANKGRIKGDRIAIKRDIPTLAEKSCVLAEELGHYYTTVGNILDQSIDANRKQELKARMWAYDKQVGLSGLIDACENKCETLHDMAEYLEVTEEFLAETLEAYASKYGLNTKVGNYTIYFEPLRISLEKNKK